MGAKGLVYTSTSWMFIIYFSLNKINLEGMRSYKSVSFDIDVVIQRACTS